MSDDLEYFIIWHLSGDELEELYCSLICKFFTFCDLQ